MATSQYIKAGAGGSNAFSSIILNGATAGSLTLSMPATVTSYSLVFPNAQGGVDTFLKNDGSGNLSWTTVAGTGTVTSVGVITDSTTDSIFANTAHVITGSPVTTSGNMTLTLSTQTANQVFASATSGGAAAPAFRALVAADIPNLAASKITSGTLATARGGTNGDSSGSTGLAKVAAGTWSYATLVNADVDAAAAIAFSKLASLTAAHILVGSAGNVATDVAVSGDLTCTNAGAFTVAKIQTVTVSGVTGTTNVVFSASPTIASPNFTTQATFGNYHLEPSEVDDGNSSTADTIDWSAGSAHKSTLTGNCTYTFSNPVTGGSYVLRVLTGAGSFTVTWPAAVKWPSNTAPTVTETASRMDLFTFYWDGTNYWGAYQQAYVP